MLRSVVQPVIRDVGIPFRTGGGDKWEDYWVTQTEAKAFGDAAGIIDEPTQRALATLIIDLKAINAIQTDFVNFTTPANSVLKAFYPFVGGTESSCKFNLMNPVDSDAAYRIVFDVGFAFDSDGVKGGAGLKSDTKLNFNNFTFNDFCYGHYHSNSTKEWEMMQTSGFNIGGAYVTRRWYTSALNLFSSAGGLNIDMKKYIYTQTGLEIINLKSFTDLVFWKDVIIHNAGSSAGALGNGNIWIGAWNPGGAVTYSDIDPIGLFFAGKGLASATLEPFASAIYKFLHSTNKLKHNYYFYGDSITTGYNAAPQATKRFSYLLNTRCGGMEWNRGSPGQILPNYLSGISFETEITSVADNTKYIDYYYDPASFIFIGYGVNEANLGSYVLATSLTAWANVVDLILITKNWPYSHIIVTGPFIRLDYDIPNQSAFNQSLKTMLEAKGCPYVNVFDALNGTTGYVDADNIHLTNAGHQFISDLIYTKLVAEGLI